MATAAERLVEAEAAYHSLLLGNKPSVVVDQNGERVEFARTDLAKLRQYIEELKALIAGTGGRYGPMGAWF